MPKTLSFATRLIDWQRREGRHGLPWQSTRDPYRVWLSEVMLQQTQVATVLDYYPRFLARFPDVQALARAEQGEVLALWSGLGYYSRARNLHRCAQMVVLDHGGVFPNRWDVLQTLPGIGASTAAAIAAFCFGERVSIVDGNVRRVLSRLLAFEGDLAKTPAQRALWNVAQTLLPQPSPVQASDMQAYTQGLMDLGATLCTRSRPACERCPVQALCQAHASDQVARFPIKTRTLKRRSERWWLLCRFDPSEGGWVWLEQRPQTGIWAGLYCPPVFTDEAQMRWALDAVPQQAVDHRPVVSHALTHRELTLHPTVVRCTRQSQAGKGAQGQWVALRSLDALGLPKPIRTWLDELQPEGSGGV
jgi:A/G-specific adenine glycosylase